MTIAEIRLAYDLKSLLKKRLDLHMIEIVQPQLTLVQESDGHFSLDKIFVPESQTPGQNPVEPEAPVAGGWLPFALVVESLQLRDGQMTLRLPSLPGMRQVEDLQAQLNARVDQEGLRVQVQQFTAYAHPAEVEIRSLQGALQALGNGVHLDKLNEIWQVSKGRSPLRMITDYLSVMIIAPASGHYVPGRALATTTPWHILSTLRHQGEKEPVDTIALDETGAAMLMAQARSIAQWLEA